MAIRKSKELTGGLGDPAAITLGTPRLYRFLDVTA